MFRIVRRCKYHQCQFLPEEEAVCFEMYIAKKCSTCFSQIWLKHVPFAFEFNINMLNMIF